jgi:hypothetical protein
MRKAFLSILLASALPALTARAAVRVVIGPTPIVGGEARAAADLTVINEKLAFALAVQTAPPYGIPRGAVIDVAPVRNGQVGRDRAVFADFIPNNWSGWPNSYHRLDVIERGPRRAVIRTVRDWGKVTLTTVYTLDAGSDHVVLRATMHNASPTALVDLLSGFTLWPKGGYLFGVPGLRGAERGTTEGALADRMVAYDRDWSVALHAPYADHIANGSRDMFREHTLAPGASRTFEAWLQVGPSGDLAPVLRAEIAAKHLEAGTLSGSVTDGRGDAVAEPVVVVDKDGQPYAWALGHRGRYEMSLPAGEYRLYATAKDYSQTTPVSISIEGGARANLDFKGLAAPGRIRFSVVDATSAAPLDASIIITQGQRPLVEFLGRKKFFTELDRKGLADITVAPGEYRFRVSHGGAFLAPGRDVALTVDPRRDLEEKVPLTVLFDPPARGWYSADLHHHADQAEAVTPPSDLARSELAAGLDLLFVSDHDSTVNHRPLQAIAARRGVPLIPSVEFSASWGHFNAYPLSLGEKLAIDTGTASVSELFAEARRLGAIVIQVNHPFIPYGYFTSVAAGVAPGGFDPAFDLMEMNASVPEDDEKVIHQLWQYWNERRPYYLAAGTDTHDVWNEESGRVRAFAHPDGAPTAASFAEALKAGHAYVSHGPLIFPSIVFGTRVQAAPGRPVKWAIDLQSIAGLKRADLIGGGVVIDSRDLQSLHGEAHLEFTLAPDHSAWYALVVEDVQGQKAYTDPLWVDVPSTVSSRAAPLRATPENTVQDDRQDHDGEP